MLFNSYEFLLGFLPIVYFGYVWLRAYPREVVIIWLGLASLVFYGWWNPAFLWILLTSIVFNYVIGARLAAKPHRSGYMLSIGVVTNLGALAYFKYANFFVAEASTFLGLNWKLDTIVLPLGISFFTFTQIAFLVDAHRGKAKERDFFNYLLFVTYFPHLIAGPVIHHAQVMPQFHRLSAHPGNRLLISGTLLFTIGLAKKVLVADSFAEYASPVFGAASSGEQIRFISAWVGALAYTLQLYFDFSGYSDMAVGLSRMLGIELPINFNSPYKSASIIEFWRRWHMTLSQFLRDYLYISLGGNRCSPSRQKFNLLTTMLLGGLWHGANWTFIVWGGIHGVLLLINHLWRELCPRRAASPSRARRVLVHGVSVGATFLVVVFAWVIFRADSLDTAWRIVFAMLMGNGLSLHSSLSDVFPVCACIHYGGFFDGIVALKANGYGYMLALFIIGLMLVFAFPNSNEIVEKLVNAQVMKPWVGTLAGLLLGACLLSMNRVSEFLYFQF